MISQDENKTKKQLIDEIAILRNRVLELPAKSTSGVESQESERRLWSLLQNSSIVAIEWNLDFEVTEWNAAAERVFGYSKAEALGKHAAGLIVPEAARKLVNEVWNSLLENSGGFHSENENFTKDGRTIVCDWRNTTLVDNSGNVSGVVSLVQDITERKQAEIELQASEEKYRNLVESNPYGFEVIDVEGNILYSNPAYQKMLGYSEEELSSKSTLDLLDSDEAREKLRTFLPFLVSAQPEPTTYEQKACSKDGRIIDQHVHWNYNRNSAGQVIGFSSFISDITERKQTEEALRESENKYRTLFDQTADAILIIEGEQFVDCNSATVKMLGYKNKQELLETHPSELSPEMQPDGKSSFDKANEMISIALREGSHRFEWDHKRHNGEIFPVEVLLTSVPFQGKNFLHVVWRDITETKRLREMESRAERLETAGTIAGQVAHDFNNLLAPIVAYPGLIREHIPKDNKSLKFLDQMEKAARRIATINQDLLTMGRRGHFNREALDLNKVVQNSLDDLKPYPVSLECKSDLAEDLMPIFGGGAQLHRMISNMLQNARDAMQNDGLITVTTENYYVDDVSVMYGRVPKGEYVKLTITDVGCGIPDDIVQKIFDPFFSSKEADKERGSGLGMSVVDAVVKDHNGYIDLATKLGEGTSIYIYFPITRKMVDSIESAEICGGSESILVVDDDEVQREVSSLLLTKLGYNVNIVDSGEKAIEFIRENPQDLVVLDMIMPGGIDGTDTYRNLLKICPNQRAIIVSGYSESDRVKEVRALGVRTFVKKPISLEEIAAAVRTELDRQVQALA